MKTIGTCKDCEHWEGYCNHPKMQKPQWITETEKTESSIDVYDDSYPIGTSEDFGCIHWEYKSPALENYPVKSAKDLLIEDLQRENDAAFQRIQELSQALVNLGYDPTSEFTIRDEHP